MADKDIMIAGARKTYTVTVYMKGVEGSSEVYDDVTSWRIGYNGILTLQGNGWTDIMSMDIWTRIIVRENNQQGSSTSNETTHEEIVAMTGKDKSTKEKAK
jgi:hypothetical protein